MSDEPNAFADFTFPQILHVSGLITDQLVPLKALTEVDRIKGREVKPYPFKYDFFNSVEDIIEHIRLALWKRPDLDKSWLVVSTVVSMPINIYEKVFYENNTVISIGCTEPARNPQHDMRNGMNMAKLHPEYWNIEELKLAINTFKAE